MPEPFLLLPRYASRHLLPGEAVRYFVRPRAVRLGMLLLLGTVVLALAVFSAIIEDPGFMRLSVLPGLPLLGALAGDMAIRPLIFATDRRVISAGRGMRPLIVEFEHLKSIDVVHGRLGRQLGWSELTLAVTPPPGAPTGLYLAHSFDRIPAAMGLASAVSEGASRRGFQVTVREHRLSRIL